MEASVKYQCERYAGREGIVKRAFVALREPGRTPEKKGAFLTEEQLVNFVRDCIRSRSPETTITVCRLLWNDDLWFDDGREMIDILDSFNRRKLV